MLFGTNLWDESWSFESWSKKCVLLPMDALILVVIGASTGCSWERREWGPGEGEGEMDPEEEEASATGSVPAKRDAMDLFFFTRCKVGVGLMISEEVWSTILCDGGSRGVPGSISLGSETWRGTGEMILLAFALSFKPRPMWTKACKPLREECRLRQWGSLSRNST